jgi:hypothetical protein
LCDFVVLVLIGKDGNRDLRGDAWGGWALIELFVSEEGKFCFREDMLRYLYFFWEPNSIEKL